MEGNGIHRELLEVSKAKGCYQLSTNGYYVVKNENIMGLSHKGF